MVNLNIRINFDHMYEVWSSGEFGEHLVNTFKTRKKAFEALKIYEGINA